MRKLTRNTLTVAAASAATLAVVAGPAHAATWSVTSPGKSGTISITGTNTTTLTAKIYVGTSNTLRSVTSCDTATAGGSVVLGTGLASVTAKVTSLSAFDSSFGSPYCAGPSGTAVQITPVFPASPNNFWAFSATSYAGGVTTGTLNSVKATFVSSSGCTGTVSAAGGGGGSLAGTYTNNATAGVLSTSASTPATTTLRITAASGCTSTEAVLNDAVVLAGSFKVAPNVTITSP